MADFGRQHAEPSVKNEAIAALEPLVGTWKLTITNAWFLDSLETKVEGTARIEWLDKAFLVLRSDFGDEAQDWTWVFGRSDANDRYQMLYHDGRGVARVFEMTFGDGRWTISREDPDFHQRIVSTVEPDRIMSQVDASEDAGASWRKDFDLIWERQG
jgi:hypothetical protein